MTEYPGRILAVDYGSKRVGIAVSDEMRMIARGVTTLENNERLLDSIAALLVKEEVSFIVVGMPYSADGGKGTKALEVDEFIAKLSTVTNVKIDTWDESYSSVDAQRAFIDSGMRQKKRREKHRVDEMAARIILQQYLDHLRQSPYA